METNKIFYQNPEVHVLHILSQATICASSFTESYTVDPDDDVEF